MTASQLEAATSEEATDLVDCLKRLEQAAAEDNWCEFSGYSSRLVWRHILQLAALAYGAGAERPGAAIGSQSSSGGGS